MKLWIRNTILIAAVIIIAIIPLVIVRNSEFGGADGKAEEIIKEVDSEYQPWFEPVISPPGGETESLLFVLQGAIGAGVIGFILGRMTARKGEKSNNDDNFDKESENSKQQ